MDALNKKTILTDLSKLCRPALLCLIYVVLVLVGSLGHFMMTGFSDLKGLGSGFEIGIIGSLWAFLLQYLCQHNYTNLAWILLFMPYIYFFIGTVIFFSEGYYKSKLSKTKDE